MNIEHLASSDFIKGDDLQGKQVQVTINAAELKTYDDGSQKVVLSFADSEKKLTLNKTRLKTMMALYGPDTDQWLGKQIILTAQPLASGRFAGQWTVIILQPQAQANDTQALAQEAQNLGGVVVSEQPQQPKEIPF